MKPFIAGMFIAAVTLPLAVPASSQAQDSPLVRAAKASGRLNKKPGIVITNETLVRTGGHFATADVTTEDPEAKTRRDAASMKLQRLKASAAANTTYGEPYRPAAPQPQLPQTEGRRMTMTELSHVTTTQLGTMSTTQVGTSGTTQLSTMPATRLGTASTSQLPTATTVAPPHP